MVLPGTSAVLSDEVLVTPAATPLSVADRALRAASKAPVLPLYPE
jgi:hypothetical protein